MTTAIWSTFRLNNHRASMILQEPYLFIMVAESIVIFRTHLPGWMSSARSIVTSCSSRSESDHPRNGPPPGGPGHDPFQIAAASSLALGTRRYAALSTGNKAWRRRFYGRQLHHRWARRFTKVCVSRFQLVFYPIRWRPKRREDHRSDNSTRRLIVVSGVAIRSRDFRRRTDFGPDAEMRYRRSIHAWRDRPERRESRRC